MNGLDGARFSRCPLTNSTRSVTDDTYHTTPAHIKQSKVMAQDQVGQTRRDAQTATGLRHRDSQRQRGQVAGRG